MTLIVILSAVAIAGLLAALAALWRRMEDLSGEVKTLRSAVGHPAKAERRLSAPVRHKVLADATAQLDENLELFPSSNAPDLFESTAWAPPADLQQTLAPVAAGRRTASSDPTPLRLHQSVRLIGAFAVVAAPALELLAAAPAPAVVAAGLLFSLALLALSRLDLWRGAAWIAAAGGTGWALWGVLTHATASNAPVLALMIALAGVIALVHAATSEEILPASLFALGLTLVSFMLASGPTQAAEALVAMAILTAAAALIGSATPRLEALHLAGWVTSCIALYVLSGQESRANIWFAPAAAWAAALFLGIALVRAPLLLRQGAVVAATGAGAPILAAMTVHAVTQNSSETTAGLLCVIGALLAGVLAAAGERARGLTKLGLTALPLGLGAPAAFALAALVALPTPYAATALGLLSAVLIAIDQRFHHPMWRVVSFAIGLVTLWLIGACALRVVTSNEAGVPLVYITFGVAAPALTWLAAAFTTQQRTPMLAMILETAGAITALVALFLLFRWIATDGAPADGPYGFGEMGAHATLWLGLSLLFTAFGEDYVVRRALAALLAGAAIAALVLGPLGVLNPLWGAWRQPVHGLPILNVMALGFGAPALAALAAGFYWRKHNERVLMLSTATASGVLGLLWAALEVRRAFHGAALDEGATPPAEAMTLSALIAAALIAAGAWLYFTRSRTMISGRPASTAPSLGPAARK